MIRSSLWYEIGLDLSLGRWYRQGCPVPPPGAVKQRTVIEYGRQFGLPNLVETGTFLGAMVMATRNHFSRIDTIELDHGLWERATQLVSPYPHVHVHNGDSAVMLETIVSSLTEPALFWLDAHYSGPSTAQGGLDTPVRRELDIVLGSNERHVVLIDDARAFGTEKDYPTLEEIRQQVTRLVPKSEMSVSNDIIRITPPRV